MGFGSSRPTNAAGISSSIDPPPDPPLRAQVTTSDIIAEYVSIAIGTTTDEGARSKVPHIDDV